MVLPVQVPAEPMSSSASQEEYDAFVIAAVKSVEEVLANANDQAIPSVPSVKPPRSTTFPSRPSDTAMHAFFLYACVTLSGASIEGGGGVQVST